MRRLLLLAVVLAAFPVGLGFAVYAASGSSLGSPAASARVPTGTIARPSKPPVTTVDTRRETERCGKDDRSDDCPREGTTTERTTTSDSGLERETTNRTTTSDSHSRSDSRRSGSGDDD